MAFSINRVTLLGNLSQEPELKYTPEKKAVCRLNVVTNHSIMREDKSWEDIPSFHRVVVWGKLAEFIAGAVAKGSKIYVDGSLKYGNYEDKDGVKRYTFEIVGKNVIPMSEKNPVEARKEEVSEAMNGGEDLLEVEDVSDDIPF
jgi:single-strand DNA-binding protein